MKNLTPLPNTPTYISYFIAIRDAKRIPVGNRGTCRDHLQILTASSKKIEDRYGKFEKALKKRSLDGLRPSIAMVGIASSLRSCYDGDTKRLRDLKDSIAAVQGVRALRYCPLCGITSVATHDHYMPATLFPEFAVHPLNLVPCCLTCNSTKGDDWLDENHNRLFVHAYSDLIPAEAFLDVKLKTSKSATGVGAVFSITRPTRFSRKAWNIIESHFERLKLIQRYTDFANDEIAEIIADCKIYNTSGGTNVRRFLRQRARERASVHGESHWRSVLMRKLADANSPWCKSGFEKARLESCRKCRRMSGALAPEARFSRPTYFYHRLLRVWTAGFSEANSMILIGLHVDMRFCNVPIGTTRGVVLLRTIDHFKTEVPAGLVLVRFVVAQICEAWDCRLFVDGGRAMAARGGPPPSDGRTRCQRSM